MLAFTIEPRQIADVFTNSSRLLLNNLPRNQYGLYALFDHHERLRYVGQTACQGGFYDRICNKHVTGSTYGRPGTAGRSHKFASEYIPLMGRKAARGFARKYCRAIVFPILGRPPLGVLRTNSNLQAYEAGLRSLEVQVVAILRARGFALDWNI